MSFEIKNCSADQLLVYNNTIPCRGYDDVIYNQLPDNQKLLVKACGYARLESKKAFSNMLLDVHYLDRYSKKKRGDPFKETTTDYTERFLKSAEIEDPDEKDMIIPFNPVPRRSNLRTRLDFSMTTTPNNTASHSVFLYIPDKKRNYEELLFLCKTPGIPPPTPPEVLAQQMETLEKLQMNQKQLLQIIQEVVSSLKDALKRHLLLMETGDKQDFHSKMKDLITSLKEPLRGPEEEEEEEVPEESTAPLKPYTTLLQEINAYKAERKDEEKRVALYKKFTLQVFSTYQALDKEIIEMEDKKRTLDKYKKTIEDAKAPERTPAMTADEAFDMMTSMSNPSGFTEGVKKVFSMMWKDTQQKYYNTVAYVKQQLPGYPTKQQIQELEASIPAHQLQIDKLQESLQPSKEVIQESRDALPAWYTQNTIELYVDSKLGLAKRDISQESIRLVSQKERMYTQNCKYLELQETSSEEGTYRYVSQMIQLMKYIVVKKLNSGYLESDEDEDANTIFTRKVIIQFMIQMPEPTAASFDEYKQVWGYDKCGPSQYYLPHKGDDKTTSILLPTFESFVSMVLRYKNITPLATILAVA